MENFFDLKCCFLSLLLRVSDNLKQTVPFISFYQILIQIDEKILKKQTPLCSLIQMNPSNLELFFVYNVLKKKLAILSE